MTGWEGLFLMLKKFAVGGDIDTFIDFSKKRVAEAVAGRCSVK